MEDGLPDTSGIDNHIGQKLRALRETSGHSMEVFAHRLGISLNQYRRYERGHSAMKCSMLVCIAERLALRLEHFLSDFPLAIPPAPEPEPKPKRSGRAKAEWRLRIEELAREKPIGTTIRFRHGTLPSIPSAKRVIALTGKAGWAQIHYTSTGTSVKKLDHP